MSAPMVPGNQLAELAAEALNARAEKRYATAQAAQPQQVPKFVFDVGNFTDEEKSELRKKQKDFALAEYDRHATAAELRQLYTKESFKDEKNAFADNSLNRVLAIEPTRGAHVNARLREGDLSYLRDTNNDGYKSLRSATIRLRNHKDHLYRERVERILFESNELSLYDKFTRIQKEAKSRAQRLDALKAYVSAALRNSSYKNPQIQIPVLFKVNSVDMQDIYDHRRLEFKKGRANSIAGLAVSTGIFFQAIFALIGVYFLERSTRKKEYERLARLGGVCAASVLCQLYFWKRSHSKLAAPGKVSSVLGAGLSIIISSYVSYILSQTKDVMDDESYQNARYSVFACYFFCFCNIFATCRAFLQLRVEVGVARQKVRTQGLFATGIAAMVTVLIMLPVVSESKGRCGTVSKAKCLDKLTPDSLSDLLYKNAYENTGALRDCVNALDNHDNMLVNSFNNLSIPTV